MKDERTSSKEAQEAQQAELDRVCAGNKRVALLCKVEIVLAYIVCKEEAQKMIDNNKIQMMREGIKSGGFPQIVVDAIRFSEKESQSGNPIITITLDFIHTTTINSEFMADAKIDLFHNLGLRFARELQVQMARLLPSGYIEVKVIVPVKEYESLKLRAGRYFPPPVYDSEFGRITGTKP